jgi:[CysO sulfur-carrier protein]-S-L-cysteine hydrolase
MPRLGANYENLAGIPTVSTPFQLSIPRAIYDAMIAQALAELPNECCGILAGSLATGEVVHCYPLVNAAASPTEYLSDPRSMFEAVRDMRIQGIDMLAVYHSHPTSAPIPSRKDLERNYSPDVINVIISLKDGKAEPRAWWLSEKDFREAAWQLVE